MPNFLDKLASALKETSTDDGALAGFREWSALTRGSPQEYRVFKDLEHRGFAAGIDFTFQADRLGGLSRIGNAKIHFFLPMGKVAIRVQGVKWTQLSVGSKVNDRVQTLIWEGKGWFVADLVSEEVDSNTHRVVGLALSYQNTAAARASLGA